MLVGLAGGAWAYCESSSCSVFLIGCLEEVCLGQEDSEAIMITHLREGKGGLVACHKGAFFSIQETKHSFCKGFARLLPDDNKNKLWKFTITRHIHTCSFTCFVGKRSDALSGLKSCLSWFNSLAEFKIETPLSSLFTAINHYHQGSYPD